MTHFVVWTFSVGAMILGAGAVYGQNPSTELRTGYPNKTIRIVTAEPGGSGDFASRMIAQALSASLGQQVIVENRPSGNILAEVVSKAPPDGYTLLFAGTSHWIGPLIQNTPYDPVRDFLPITSTTISPSVLVVHPSVPAKSVKELIALAKARPGELNYGSSATGSGGHLAAELLKSMAGISVVRVSYKSAGPALNALIAGEVQLTFPAAGGVAPHITAGKVRALAVTSAKPSALLPDLPTVAATIPGYEAIAIMGMFAPAGTPATIINRLHQEIARALNQPGMKQKFFDSGVETVGSSPEEFAAAIRADMGRMGKVIKDAGIRAD